MLFQLKPTAVNSEMGVGVAPLDRKGLNSDQLWVCTTIQSAVRFIRVSSLFLKD